MNWNDLAVQYRRDAEYKGRAVQDNRGWEHHAAARSDLAVKELNESQGQHWNCVGLAVLELSGKELSGMVSHDQAV